MICPGCKKTVRGRANFCPNCGMTLQRENDAENTSTGEVPKRGSDNQAFVFPVVDFIIGVLVQVLLWILLWLICSKCNGGWMLLLLVVLSGASLIIPLIVSSGINNVYGVSGIQIGCGIAQGAFTVFPFMSIENWDFFTGLVVLCLVATIVSYFIGVFMIAKCFPANLPRGKRMTSVVLQGVFGFAIGTIVSIIVAVVFALFFGRRKK